MMVCLATMKADRKKRASSPYTDPVTARRHQMMMASRLPALVVGLAFAVVVHSYWPPFVALVIWYVVWLICVADAGRH